MMKTRIRGSSDSMMMRVGLAGLLFALLAGTGPAAAADFSDATGGLPLGDAGLGEGVAWGDYDNDGDLDLYLANWNGANKLFRNDGGTFVDATSGPLGDTGYGFGVAWGDYNNDGDLDLYLANNLGQANKLFRNDGGTFVDATSGPLGDTGYGIGVAWGDYDNDGDLDLYLVNSGSANKLFRNDGDTFVDATSGPLGDAGNGGGVAWGDYDNDGDLDLYLVNLYSANKLFRNDGGWPGGTFVDMTSGPLGDTGNGYGVAWGDYDNDGDLDLYLANAQGQANKLFRNDGGTFVDATSDPLGDTGNGHSVAWADYDNDGDLDLYLVNTGQANKLFHNEVANGNHWLQVKLQGTVSNRAGIGARVEAVAGGVTQIREISGGSGLGSQDAPVASFGLGSATTVTSLEVRWPSGIVNVMEPAPAVDQVVTVEESGQVVLPSLAIGGVMHLEGDSGTQDYVFELSLSSPTDQTVTVAYATADGSATVADNDYVAASGTATIDPGEVSTTVTVVVNGDTKEEPTEAFYVELSSASNATLANTRGTGTILSEDVVTGTFWQQGDKLVGAGAVGGEQGYSVALSADGNTAIVGGPYDDPYVGAAWVWTRSGGVWSQQGEKLVGTGAVGDAWQGLSVALSADGNTAIVGGYGDNHGAGAAWVFTRSGGVWSQQGEKLVGTGAVGAALQGGSVALSADGNTAIVGGSRDNASDGAAWVYTRCGGVWSQQGEKLVGTGAVGGANQGSSVAVSADGNAAIVGGIWDSHGIGAAWMYARSGGVWSQQGAKLVGTGAVGGANQGSSVALSADGNTTIVGGQADNSYMGAVWVFTRSGGVWSQQGAKLVGTGAVYYSPKQGSSVALSADGNTAIVGGGSEDFNVGAVWVFTRSGGAWSQQGTKLLGMGAVNRAQQGHSVALSADGNTAMVGGPGDDPGLPAPRGAAWVFVRTLPLLTIDDVAVMEGDAGTTTATFTVSLDGPVLGGESVDYATAEGTATTADGDYVAASGTLTFLAGETSRTIEVTVNGDTKPEGDETFTVTLSNPVGLTIGDGGGAGTIGNDDGVPRVAISSVMQFEGDSGTQAFVFDLSLSTPSGQAVTVAYATADGSARVANNDYVAASGTATFDPGEVSTTVTVVVNGDTKEEPTEAFYVELSSPSNATLANTRGTGTILSEDVVTGTFWQQGDKLVGAGVVGAGFQGYSVALSADGNTAIVGAPGDNDHGGAAWVYTRSGGVWSQQGEKLVGTGAVGAAQQGMSVALSADGNTAVVGGPMDNGAWVYTRSGGVWSQQGEKLVGTGGGGHQGWSVALSADGNTAVVGGPADNSNMGAVWVFTRSCGVWSQQGEKLVGTGAVSGALQGYSVALSADGNTAIVGGYFDNSGAGAAWVYTRSGGVWSQQGEKLVGAGAVFAAYQGWSVALSADGNTAMVGGPSDNIGAGAAWVWTRSGGVWSQQGEKLVGTGAAGWARQGTSVALSADGNTAMVGGYKDWFGLSDVGATWVWTRSGGVWSQQGEKLVGSTTSAARQGYSVALSADGTTAMVGGPGDNSDVGAAWVFVDLVANTLPGTDVSVNPEDGGLGLGDVGLTFSNVTEPGVTTLSSSSTEDPPPAGFAVGDPPAYFEVSTTAVYSGAVEVCFDYSGLSFKDESRLHVFHQPGGVGPWEDATSSLDTENNVICATVTSLSPFGLMEETWTTGVGEEIPVAFALQAAAPNPFSTRAVIGFALPQASGVRLEVYDLAGRVVCTLADGEYAAGRHAVEWNGTDATGRRLGAGVYLCRLRAAGFTATRRVVLMP